MCGNPQQNYFKDAAMFMIVMFFHFKMTYVNCMRRDNNYFGNTISKEEGKDQESIQSK